MRGQPKSSGSRATSCTSRRASMSAVAAPPVFAAHSASQRSRESNAWQWDIYDRTMRRERPNFLNSELGDHRHVDHQTDGTSKPVLRCAVEEPNSRKMRGFVREP